MINFRYHLVSLLAVFLALAVGIVVGSTVVDRAIVDGLRSRIDEVERKADARKDENERLRAEVGRLEEYAEETAPWAVAGRLTGVPVAVIAESDADDGALDAAVLALRDAGASAPVLIRLEGRWAPDDAEEAARVAEALGAPGAAGDPARLRALAADRLVAELRTPGAPLLGDLVEAGLVAVEGVEGGDPDGLGAWPGPALRTLVVTRGGLDPEASERADRDATVTALLDALTAAEVPTVLAEAHPGGDGEERGRRVVIARDGDHGDAVSTVDDLDRVEGRVAAVLALADLARGLVGHYGQGRGADAPVPVWPGS